MTQLNQNVYTVTNSNPENGTLELAGVDSESFGTYSWGIDGEGFGINTPSGFFDLSTIWATS
jgi:hypothetical protein